MLNKDELKIQNGQENEEEHTTLNALKINALFIHHFNNISKIKV